MLGAVPRSRRTSSSRRRSQNRHHGFSNVKETLEEIHKGVSKAYPCGAGLGLMGVRPTATSRCATASPAPTRTSSARCATASIASAQQRVPRAASHREQDRLQHVLGAAAVLGRLLSRGAHALRRRRRGRTCITATGFAAGPTPACRSTASCRSAIPAFLAQFDDDDGGRTVSCECHEASEGSQPQGRRASIAPTRAGRRRAAADRRSSPQQPHIPHRLLARVLAGLGSGSHRRHRRAVPAGRARSVRLPHRLLLAGAGARPAQSRARLDGKCAAAQKDWRKIDLVFP